MLPISNQNLNPHPHQTLGGPGSPAKMNLSLTMRKKQINNPLQKETYMTLKKILSVVLGVTALGAVLVCK